ncbi:GNAT family N-acetyltransferase [Magnetovibrio sp.]|uniref:GNAT family N-acetyltransferase n=1 Tax=Magnetovibrio sp. TaxID=2024836 RepID=UPI002F94FC1B
MDRSPSPTATRGAPRSQKSHRAILAAAMRLAETGGAQVLTIEAVAREAGVGKQTIYRWWPTRLDLLIEVYDAYAPPLQDLDSQRPLKSVLLALFQTYENGPAGELLAALIALSRVDADAHDTFKNRFVVPRQEALTNYLALTGETRRETAAAAAELVVALIWHALLSAPERLNADYAERICALVHQDSPPIDAPTAQAFTIHEGYRTGLAGALVTLHMNYYSAVWNFGRNFETLVTRDFGLLLDKYDPERDQLIRAENRHGDIVGTLIVEASGYPSDVARIRFFVLASCAQGQGLGQAMLAQALGTCRQRGQHKVFLTTFKGLDAARTLYERAGFILTEEYGDDDWGEGSQEVRYDLAPSA